MSLSIKKISRLIAEEKPKSIAKYIAKFLPKEKRKRAEVKLDEYAHSLVEKQKVSKESVLNKIQELSKI